MKSEYIVDLDFLQNRGLDLNAFVIDTTYINAVITNGLDIAVSRICKLNDNFKEGELSVEEYLDKNPHLVNAFKKLQYRVIYNMIWQAEREPVDSYVDTIITHEMGCGKINGFQKGVYWSNR